MAWNDLRVDAMNMVAETLTTRFWRFLRYIGVSPVPDDPQLGHPRLQRGGLDPQNLRGPTGAANSPASLLKDAKNLPAHALA